MPEARNASKRVHLEGESSDVTAVVLHVSQPRPDSIGNTSCIFPSNKHALIRKFKLDINNRSLTFRLKLDCGRPMARAALLFGTGWHCHARGGLRTPGQGTLPWSIAYVYMRPHLYFIYMYICEYTHIYMYIYI